MQRIDELRVLAALAAALSCTPATGAVPEDPDDPAYPADPADPGAPPVASLECAAAKPEWIWCDDFESDRLGRYFEYDNASGNFTRAADVGVANSTGMLVRYRAGIPDAGSLKLAFGRTPDAYFRAVDAGTAHYREVYWRVFVRYPPAWTGGGGFKMSRALSFASGNWSEAMVAHVWSGGSAHEYLIIDPASGTDAQGSLRTTGYNDWANMRWLGSAQSSSAVFAPQALGAWRCIEASVRLNDASQSNGAFRLWIDGTLAAERTGLNWVGAYVDYGINAVFIENYWNGGAPANQERYFDMLVVSTQRVGCAI
ncbi:MAG: hypothetical protein ACRENI_09265 [Gemmatimonadaceae bacterium]